MSLIYLTIYSLNKDILTSSFPICFPMTSFNCLIVIARTSSPILNKNGDGGCIVLLLILVDLFEFLSIYFDVDYRPIANTFTLLIDIPYITTLSKIVS